MNLLTGMRQRHWEILYKAVGLDSKSVKRENWTLDSIIKMGFADNFEEISRVAALASQEIIIEISLDEIETKSNSMQLEMIDHRTTGMPARNLLLFV